MEKDSIEIDESLGACENGQVRAQSGKCVT